MNPSIGKDESLNSLSVILHLAKRLHSVQDVESIARNSLSIVRKCNGLPISCIYRYNPEEHNIRLMHSRGLTKKVKTLMEQLPFRESHAKLRISNNLDDDSEIDDSTRSVLKQAGLTSIVSIPLTCENEIYGILILLFKEPKIFSEIDTMTFTSLGIIISTAIANTSLLSTLKTESESGNKMRSALSGAGIGLMEWNIAGNTVHADETCAELLGYEYSEHDFSIDQWEDLIHPDDLASVRPRIDACLSGNTVNYEIEFRLRGSENPCKWLLHMGKIITYNENGAPVLLAGTVLDITRRKTAEMSLAESEEKFRTFTEFSPIPIMIYQDNKWIYANPSAIKITGYSAAELLTMNFWEFVHPDFRDLIKQRGSERQEGGNPVSHYEFKIVHKGGDEKWVDFWAQPVNFKGKIAVLIAAIDITQRKNFEAKQKNLEEQLQHSQRLEAIGRLAGGVAHDFNNLLSPIMGYAELLLTECEEDIPLKRKLGEILKAAESAKALTGHLLAFSRKQLLQQNVINLNTLLDNFLLILKRTIRENIRIRLVPHTNLWNIMGDSGQIEQILMNMTINAQDAMPDGGDLIIETTNVTLDILYSDEHHQIDPGEYVLLTISDTGTGIDRETIENIFDPFYTTKPHGMGTGLGLSTVYGIVRQHRGHIHVYSEPGKGSSFKIYFPREKEEISNINTDRTTAEIVSGDETILLVEDETMVREMTARVLQSIGYSIIEASSAEEALKKAGTYNGTLHLLLTDIIMQDMNGIDLYQRISAKRPGLKVLFMSGYNPDLLDSLDLLVSTENYIQKPFSIKILSKKIKSILSTKF